MASLSLSAILNSSFDDPDEIAAVQAFLAQLPPDEIRSAMARADPGPIAKRSAVGAPRKPKIDPKDDLARSRSRLRITGMTLAAQDVTGQPIGKKDSTMREIDTDIALEASASAVEKQVARIEKGNTQMLLTLAKRTTDGERVMGRDQWHSLITERAEASKQPGRSAEGAYSDFVTKTKEGRALFAAWGVENLREMGGAR